jgi:hypothetical protein
MSVWSWAYVVPEARAKGESGMSSLEQAVTWMREGKKVQRRWWSEGRAISSAEVFLLYPEDIVADDWEVVPVGPRFVSAEVAEAEA